MSESPLMIKSKSFALEVVRACKVLREAKCESALINQFLRSGTSIGANIREKNFDRLHQHCKRKSIKTEISRDFSAFFAPNFFRISIDPFSVFLRVEGFELPKMRFFKN